MFINLTGGMGPCDPDKGSIGRTGTVMLIIPQLSHLVSENMWGCNTGTYLMILLCNILQNKLLYILFN